MLHNSKCFIDYYRKQIKMSTVLMILGSLFFSFLAILFMLALEVMDIRNGCRPDWEFIIGAGLISLVPVANIFLAFIFCGFLIKGLIKQSGYLFKIENYIIKLIRGE